MTRATPGIIMLPVYGGGITTMTDIVKKTGVRSEAGNVNVGADFYDALDSKVKELVAEAVERAQENGRRTIKGRDV